MVDRDPRRMLVRLAVAVMAADGRVTADELAVLARLERSGLGPLRPLVESELERTAEMPIDVAEACVVLSAANPPAVASAFALLVDVAAADGTIDERELRLLDAIAARLGVDDATVADIVRAAAAHTDGATGPRPATPEPALAAMPGPRAAAARIESHEPPGVADSATHASTAASAGDGALARARERLGVAPGADGSAIDAAYRRIIARYDPARVLDLGPEFAVLAVRRLADATAAYELLRSHDG